MTTHTASITLRPYQHAALDAIDAAYRQGVRRPVISLPTGTGKTVIFAELLRRRGRPALVLAHRDELVRQAAEKIQQVWPEVVIGIVKGAEDEWQAPVVVASVQSLHDRRLRRWPPDRFATIIVDECFPAGTLVDGRPIETWNPGDMLRTFDPEAGQWIQARVTAIMTQTTTDLMRITTGTDTLHCTLNHPVYTPEGWIEAEFLQTGDWVWSQQGWLPVIEAVPVDIGHPIEVFNLDIDGPHTYPVGTQGIIVHNCHHAPAPSYRKILSYLTPDLLVGVSATPFRKDLTSLTTVFDRIVYSYGIREAIHDGWLVDIRAIRVHGQADLDDVATRGGDFVEDQLQTALNSPARNALIVEAYQTHAPGTKAIVFTAGVQHAHDLAQTFRSTGLAAEAVDGNMPLEARRNVLTRLRSGTTRIVTNAAVLCLDEETEILTSEGFVGIDAITPTHRVANWANGQITFELPLDIVRRPRASWERMVVLETPHRSIRVTEGHRLLYRTSREGHFKKAPARDLVGRSLQLPISGIADPLDIQPEQPPDLSPQQYQR
ncbi:MAG: DEAD/DEAH box helicase family protein, partial [Sulfobacillus sp.]|nr:DEAD/DEAH box helicase family protein [Sulfobacillus sp.]